MMGAPVSLSPHKKRRIGHLVRGEFEKALDFLFPKRCAVCRSFFHRTPGMFLERWDGPVEKKEDRRFYDILVPFVCDECLIGYTPIQSPLCTVCGAMFTSRVGDDHHCQNCIEDPKSFQKARASGKFGGVLMKIIHSFKYRYRQNLADPLGLLLYHTFRDQWEDNQIDVIIPVPLNTGRLRERGFNQACLMVAHWPAHYHRERPGDFRMMIDRKTLLRVRKTKPQVGLGVGERRANVKDAFRLRKTDTILGKHVLLVDDVYTTGATADECGALLIRGGARQVDVLTSARA